MTPSEYKRRAAAAIDAKQKVLFSLSDRIFRNPEPGLEEHKAAAWIAGTLKAEGFAVERGTAGMPTAFRGTIKGRRKRPAIVFLAEYDALPIGHACGHNIIAAAAVGAGIGVSAVLDRLPGGTIEVLGTPAEEGFGGKRILIEKGAFRGRNVAMMIHPGMRTYVHKDMLEIDRLTFRYYGRSAHAAGSPHEGINALDAAINTFVNINALRQQMRSDARVHGIIAKGGERPNIIPDYTEAHFYVRALDGPYMEDLIKRVSECARGAARAAGCRLRIERENTNYRAALPNAALFSLYRENLLALREKVEEPPRLGGVGSSDFGNVSQELPGIHGYIGIGNKPSATHSIAFRKAAGGPTGRRAILQGAKSLAFTAIDLLASPKLLAAVKADFRREKAAQNPGKK